MAKITVEIEIADENVGSLFSNMDVFNAMIITTKEKEITSAETTHDRNEDDITHDLAIIGFKEEIRPDKSPYSDLTIIYHMPHDKDSNRTYEYRVPKDNLDFILQAEKDGLIEAGKISWVTTRPWKGRIRSWIRIVKYNSS